MIRVCRSQRSTASRAIRASAVVHWVAGVSTGVVLTLELANLARERKIGTGIFGLPALSGPFERLGVERMLELGCGYVGLSVLEVLAGTLLWHRRRGGALLSVGLIHPALVFW